jgi:MFS transporter, CP family, cyanate transporter
MSFLLTSVSLDRSRFASASLFGLTIAAGANLRPVFSSTSSVLKTIDDGSGAGPLGSILVTVLPVLALGVLAPAATGISARFGAERAVALSLIAIGLGSAARAFGGLTWLIASTVLAGAGIAVANVIVPAVIKARAGPRAGRALGAYSVSLCAGAAAGAFMTPTVAMRAGQATALIVWALPAIAGALLWTRGDSKPVPVVRTQSCFGLWQSGVAWTVALFMGLQSALAYALFGWLAPMLQDRGLTPREAGALVAINLCAQMLACSIVPSIAEARRCQSALGAGFPLIAGAGFAALVIGPLEYALMFALMQGLAQGALIALATTLLVLRAKDRTDSEALSAFAQTIGYTLAGIGPLMIGAAIWQGSALLVAAWVILLGVLCAIAGWKAGARRLVAI